MPLLRRKTSDWVQFNYLPDLSCLIEIVDYTKFYIPKFTDLHIFKSCF